jgi:hypothetical protein
MAVVIREDGLMSEDFEMGTEPLIYKDAIVMRLGDYEALSPDEVQAIKQARYDSWIAIVRPSDPPPITPIASSEDTPFTE